MDFDVAFVAQYPAAAFIVLFLHGITVVTGMPVAFFTG
jgi:hypothetical protein